MTDKQQLPSDAAIREALRRAKIKWTVSDVKSHPGNYRTLLLAAQLIEKHEPESLVDPYLRRARELLAEAYEQDNNYNSVEYTMAGALDSYSIMKAILRALKEGMGDEV